MLNQNKAWIRITKMFEFYNTLVSIRILGVHYLLKN